MCLFLRYHGGETVDPSTINKLVTPIMELFQERMSGSSLVLLHQETMLVVFMQGVTFPSVASKLFHFFRGKSIIESANNFHASSPAR